MMVTFDRGSQSKTRDLVALQASVAKPIFYGRSSLTTGQRGATVPPMNLGSNENPHVENDLP